jgi:hypothetical protein
MQSKIKNIVSQERFSTRENNDGLSDPGDLVENLYALRRVQFARISSALRSGPAVNAAQVASSGDLPGNQPGLIL